MTEAAFSEAAALFKSRKYVEAIDRYKRISEDKSAAPTDGARALSNISACYAARGEYQHALNHATAALKLDPSNAKVHGRAGTAFEGLKHYEEAAVHFGKAAQLDPGNKLYSESLSRVRGFIESSRGHVSGEAMDRYYYEKSLHKGKESMKAENYLEAIRHYGKAIQLLPKNSEDYTRELAVLHSNRSAAYFRVGRMEESADDALRSTEVDPAYARAFFRLACAKMKLKKLGEAYDALQVCLRLDPEHAEGRSLLEEIEPEVLQQRRTVEQRVRDEALRVSQLQEQQDAERAEKALPVLRGTAHASNYLYCNYCNETGHTRAECPLRRRKRDRPY